MRYLPHTPATRTAMLEAIGVTHIDDLFKDIPDTVPLNPALNLANHQSELEVQQAFQSMAAKNINAGDMAFFLGAGAYRHHIPASVDALIQRGEFLTSYTPYQPEIAQGTLQYLFEFQTQVALLMGMDIANASMYDGATAAVEAVLMACRTTKRAKAIVAGNLHPHYREVIGTYGHHSDFEVILEAPNPTNNPSAYDIDNETACVIVQYPDFFGHINDFTALAKACHEQGSLLIVATTEVVALGLLKAPGAMGADIVVGEGQSLGVGLNFGGPSVGLFATKQEYVRQMPGRIAGQTVDSDGKRGWVLTLSTREQHIRRDKATSNICTNSGLCALAFSIHVSLLGEVGLHRLARLNHHKALSLYQALTPIAGVRVLNTSFFNEFTLELAKPAAEVVDKLVAHKIIAGVSVSRFYGTESNNLLIVAATEMNTDHDIHHFATSLKQVLS